MTALLGRPAGDAAAMRIPFAAVNPDSAPPKPFLKNRLKTHKTISFLKLVHGNKTQALTSFMSDNLGPIFILCNVCSLSLGTERMLPTSTD